MKKSYIGTNLLCQVGLVVNNIEETGKAYANFFGIECPEVCPSGTYEDAHTKYNDLPCLATCKMMFFDIGENLQIELIQPDETHSIWRDDLDKNGEGFHHLAFFIKDTKEKVEFLSSKGFPLVQKGDYTGGRYSYVDTRSALKVMIELLEND